MLCKDAQLQIIQRQTEGLMYHDEMSDYYAFLGLGMLKKLHHKQTKEELCSLRKAKCDYISTFGMLPFYTATDPKVIPSEWKNKTNVEVDEKSLKLLIQSSLLSYLTWEEETCDIYKASAKVFKENMNFPLYREACEMIEEVQEEICKINELLLDAALYDYCPSYFK
jgi:hypothetical protein